MPSQWDQYTSLDATERLLMAGVVLPATTAFALVDSILERTEQWMQDSDKYLLRRILALCPFVDDPWPREGGRVGESTSTRTSCTACWRNALVQPRAEPGPRGCRSSDTRQTVCGAWTSCAVRPSCSRATGCSWSWTSSRGASWDSVCIADRSMHPASAACSTPPFMGGARRDISAGISILPAPDGTFIHPRVADPTKLSSSHNRPAPEAVTSAPADVQPTGAPTFRAFLRHRSTLVAFLRQAGFVALAARQPPGTGSAQILRSMSPNSRRVRCPSANRSQ